MSLTVWHISKYVSPPTRAWSARGFLLLRELTRMGHRCVMFTSDGDHIARPNPLYTRYRTGFDASVDYFIFVQY